MKYLAVPVMLLSTMSFASGDSDCESALFPELDELVLLYSRAQIVRPAARLSLAAHLKAREIEIARRIGVQPSMVRDQILQRFAVVPTSEPEEPIADVEPASNTRVAASGLDPELVDFANKYIVAIKRRVTTITIEIEDAIVAKDFEKARKFLKLHNYRAFYAPLLSVEPQELAIAESGAIFSLFIANYEIPSAPNAFAFFRELVETPEVDLVKNLSRILAHPELVRISLDEIARRYYSTHLGGEVLTHVMKTMKNATNVPPVAVFDALEKSVRPYISVLDLNYSQDSLPPLAIAVQIWREFKTRSLYDLFLSSPSLDLDLVGTGYSSALTIAIDYNESGIVADLLKRGANPNGVAANGPRSHLRIAKSSPIIFKMLVEHPKTLVNTDENPLPIIAELFKHDYFDNAALLLKRPDIDLTLKDDKGRTPLQILDYKRSRTTFFELEFRKRLSKMRSLLVAKGAK